MRWLDSTILFVVLWTPIATGRGERDPSTTTHHKTKAASEKQHDLWCYRCDTMSDGERCLDVAASAANNHSSVHHKCAKDQKKCQVRRISMSTSTDEITGKPKLWLLQRNCSEMCEPGCIVIGERTKLHSCITCCDERNYCNAGGRAPWIRAALWHAIVPIGIVLLWRDITPRGLS